MGSIHQDSRKDNGADIRTIWHFKETEEEAGSRKQEARRRQGRGAASRPGPMAHSRRRVSRCPRRQEVRVQEEGVAQLLPCRRYSEEEGDHVQELGVLQNEGI